MKAVKTPSSRGGIPEPVIKGEAGAEAPSDPQVRQARRGLLRHPRPGAGARQTMEDEGHKIIKLNIGNLAAFGFDSPEEIQMDMIRNLPNAAGYSDSKGIFARARR